MSGGGAGLMSCVREGSLEPPYHPHNIHQPQTDPTRNGEGRTGRFLRGLRRMFKRRGVSATRHQPQHDDVSPDSKSRSTSELLDAERRARRKESAYGSGLSVSHDSVFTGERSGDESSEERQPTSHALAHLAPSHRAELVAAVRRRGRGTGDGSDDDEDLGLPRSPPASPPTDKADKRHHAGISHSSCSDGSLLSVGSSEMDEDSSSGTHHLSSTGHDHSTRSDPTDFYNSSEPPSGVAPLSHSAAKHKMAVRPRRTHGAPRRKKNNQIAASALPITPELNEEMMRSTTPDVGLKSSGVVTESLSSSTRQVITVKEHQHLLNRELNRVLEVTPNETKVKSSSLPPGLALSEIVGLSPAKLSIAESSTPRSSIKRSKSSSQRDESPNPTQSKNNESHVNVTHNFETKPSKISDDHLREKTKTEKRTENEAIRTNKKEESFFSRLLLRKSGKKSKKDQVDSEQEKKTKSDKATSTPQYKIVDMDNNLYEYGHHKVPDKNAPKTAGQRAFANQMHKRLDNRGVYVNEGVYKDVYNSVKDTGIDYNDLKIAEETDKMLNMDMKSYNQKEDMYERSKRTSSNDLYTDFKYKSVATTQNSYSKKAFTEDGLAKLLISEEEIKAPRLKNVNDYAFHSGSMPKSIPYFNNNISLSASVSPPKNVLRSENLKHFNRSTEYMSKINVENKNPITNRTTDYQIGSSSDSQGYYSNSGLRSLGDEYVEARNSIGKSHSFRYASENNSISSQENQMPSLPAIVGISEPLLESWEVNYRRSVSYNHDNFNDRYDPAKRISTRNYNIINTNDSNYDSLPSTDSSYMDSLKTDPRPDSENKSLFTNNINVVDNHKRDSDISQIEAKIDDIISSPKPIITSILKSSSLDSVQSTADKLIDERRKTVSIESALSLNVPSISHKDKPESENFISITHINRDNTVQVKADILKTSKSDEKLQKNTTNTGVPEFLNIQLNKVDPKPSTNVVLTANITPKKLDSVNLQTDIDKNVTESHNQNRKTDSQASKYKEIITESKNKISPILGRKNVTQQTQSPTTPKMFLKRKAASVDLQDKFEKQRTNSLSTEGSNEKIYDNISIDQKSYSSFGSKSSIQSTDSNETKNQDEGVIFRKKTVLSKENKKNDDEPELMKVFARRSLKLKDSEADALAKEIETKEKEEIKTKTLKNEFNASIKSRDSDKENDDKEKEVNDIRVIDIAARVSQFGAQYQRSVSVSSNIKRESAPVYNKSDVNKYKKEISDSTPEKRLRNRTFPDPSNNRDDIKSINADTLSKRPWMIKDECKRVNDNTKEVEVEREKDEDEKKENEADGSPQFKGILQMRAEWERRAKQGMTK